MIHFRNRKKVSHGWVANSNREIKLRGWRGRQEPDHEAVTKILFFIVRAKGRSH